MDMGNVWGQESDAKKSKTKEESLEEGDGKKKGSLTDVATFGTLEQLVHGVAPVIVPLAGSGAFFLRGLVGVLIQKLMNRETKFLDASKLPEDLVPKDKLLSGYFPVPDGCHVEDVALLEYLCAEIIEFVASSKENIVLTSDVFHAALSGDTLDSICSLFTLDQLHWARDAGVKMNAYSEVWFKNQSSFASYISLTLSGLLKPLVWDCLHARFLGHVGSADYKGEENDDDGFNDMPNFAFAVLATDGEGRSHELTIVMNMGNADANTGIFGYCFSSQGLWCTFLGHEAGDCGTKVISTLLARKRWFPIKEKLVVPEGVCWSDNSWEYQVDALCYAWAMAGYSEPARPPISGLNRSIVRILGKKIDSRISPYIWDMISDRGTISFPPYNEETLSAFQKGERNPHNLLLLSLEKRGHQHATEVEFNQEWPESGCGAWYDANSNAHLAPFSAQDAAEAYRNLTEFEMTDLYNWE